MPLSTSSTKGYQGSAASHTSKMHNGASPKKQSKSHDTKGHATPSTSQPKGNSEPLERYLKDNTVLVPGYNPPPASEQAKRTEDQAMERMKSILKGYNV